MRFGFIHQRPRWTVVGRDDYVIAPIIVDVSGSQAATHPFPGEDLAGLRGDVYKLLTLRIPQEQRRLSVMEMRLANLDGVHHVRLGDEKILPTIIIVIQESHSPCRMQQCNG